MDKGRKRGKGAPASNVGLQPHAYVVK